MFKKRILGLICFFYICPLAQKLEIRNISIKYLGTSLVTQWLRICLPMEWTWVQSLVREDFTCCRAAKPMHTTTEARTLQSPGSEIKRRHRKKKPAPCNKEQTQLTANRESRHAAVKIPCSQRENKFFGRENVHLLLIFILMAFPLVQQSGVLKIFAHLFLHLKR